MITKNKKKVLILFILLIIGGMIIFLNPKIQGMIYPGNNIKIKMRLYINDCEISLDKANVTLLRNGEEKKLQNDNGFFTAKGKEYGEFYFRVIVNDDSIPNSSKELILNLKYLNANRWYISNSECSINLTIDKDGIVGNSKVEVRYNDRTSDVYEKDIHGEDNVVNINWGL